MYRAVVLLVGLLLCVAAAAVVLAPSGPPSSQEPAAVVPLQTGADRKAAGARPESTLHVLSSLSAARVQWWPVSLVAVVLAAGGAVWLAVGAASRATQRSRSSAPQTGVAHTAAGSLAPEAARRFAVAAGGQQSPTIPPDRNAGAAHGPPAAGAHAANRPPTTGLPRTKARAPRQAARPASGREVELENPSATAPSDGKRQPTDRALDWLRSEAGDRRAAAALSAVDEALAAGGWRSRAVGAATRPDAREVEVRVELALHPAERAVGPALAERIRGAHPAWRATADGDQITLELPEQAVAPAELLLPALQLDAPEPWTHYLYAPAALGLAIVGPAARDALHGVVADLVCMYPPSGLGLTVLDTADAELYRAAPQWIEPPGPAPATIEQLAATLGEAGTNGSLRPVVLAAAEPDDELASALLTLLQRLGTLRAPPITLLVASERPGAQARALATALPALYLRTAAPPTAELRYAERRVSGLPPCFGATDMRELLRWLPRFGASPPPSIWDTIAAQLPERAMRAQR